MGRYIVGAARELLCNVEHHDGAEDGDDRQDLEHMRVDTLREAGGKMAANVLQSEVRDASALGTRPSP